MLCLLKLKLWNVGEHPDYFFQVNKFQNVKETEKSLHIISERIRLPKENVGKIDKTDLDVFSFMSYNVYCYEEDIEKYKNLLLQIIADRIQDMIIAANEKLNYIQKNTPREIIRIEDE